MRWLSAFLLLILLAPSFPHFQLGLAITAITDNREAYPGDSIPRYEKLEITFQVRNTSAKNIQLPYLPDSAAGAYLHRLAGEGISVDAEFLPPGETDWAKAFRQPAFYYQYFEDLQKDGKRWVYPRDRFAWKVRFAPNLAGVWRYRITAIDKSGIATSPIQSVNVASSQNKGFLRVSEQDPRYFAFDNPELANPTFTGLGYNRYDILQLDQVNAREDTLETLQANRINAIRTWLQPANIYSSAWSAWSMMPPVTDNYLPRVPILPYIDGPGDGGRFMWYLAEGSRWYAPCTFLGHSQPSPAVKAHTRYHITIRYRGVQISGPRDDRQSGYGLAVRITGEWLGEQCGDRMENSADLETRVTPYGGNSDGFTELTGVWDSDEMDFLPYFYLALENTRPDSKVYIERVEMREMIGGTANAPVLAGPNIIDKYSPEEQRYMAQKPSYLVDRVIEQLGAHDVYIRLVVSEKDEYLFKKIDPSGGLLFEDDNARFYGNDRSETAGRWLQKAWWRYIQARWGYSTSIHAWELTNEGDPNSSDHYAMADEFGQFMHCEVFGVPVPDLNGDGSGDGDRCLDFFNHPNDHLVSTSTWHSYPVEAFWGNTAYPNVDYADIHRYTPNLPDTAAQSDAMSLASGALSPEGPGKPVILSEGSYSDDGDTDTSEIYQDRDDDGQPDSQGIWLHHLLWAQLNAGGMYMPSEWWPDRFIYEYACVTETHANDKTRCARDPDTGETLYRLRFDYRHMFRDYYAFASNLPLTNGRYQDVDARSSDPNLQVVGQKDLTHGAAHLWIQNVHHTWKNVADGTRVAPVSAEVTIDGFRPGGQFAVEWWDTYTGQATHTTTVTADNQGRITLKIHDLATDVAIKIGQAL